jgi:hypothetical protein
MMTHPRTEDSGGPDVIRQAARLVRQRAEAATKGPWTAHPDGLVWPERLGDPVSGSTEPEDAEHIASWHPGVALPVAALLNAIADDMERHPRDWAAKVVAAEARDAARACLGTG